MQLATKTILSYLERMEFAQCTVFVGDQGRRAQQLVCDLNAGEVKAALHITTTRRFRSFRDDEAVFIVRTR